MKMFVDFKKVTMLVKIPNDRKCAASIDIITDTMGVPLAVLSFGDLDAPETDVEVQFTLEQLAELLQVVALGYNQLEAVVTEHNTKLQEAEEAKKKAKREARPIRRHMGSC